MIRAIIIDENGEPEIIELSDPIKDGWRAFDADIVQRIEVIDQRWCGPHLNYMRGKVSRGTNGEPLFLFEGTEIFAPGLLIGAVWNDLNMPEAVSLTDKQVTAIYKAMRKECLIPDRKESDL